MVEIDLWAASGCLGLVGWGFEGLRSILGARGRTKSAKTLDEGCNWHIGKISIYFYLPPPRRDINIKYIVKYYRQRIAKTTV